jgi:ribosome-binding protein aMBF1 (putative translation factor)
MVMAREPQDGLDTGSTSWGTIPPVADLIERIARNVQRHRARRRWSQAQLAEQAGVARTFIARLETRRHRDVGVVVLAKLAKALGVSVATLLK